MKNGILLFLTIIFSACNEVKNDDALEASREYCECMKENGSPAQYEYAKLICDAELAQKYYYYRLFIIEMSYKRFNGKISMAARDSAALFYLDFIKYTDSFCCEQMDRCIDPNWKPKF